MSYQYIAEIAVDGTITDFEKLYSYLIPDFMLKEIKIGYRVLVPFGASSNKRQGFVFDIVEYTQADNNKKRLKYIASICDKEPLLTPNAVKLAEWMAERTFCSLFEAAKATIPAGLCIDGKLSYALVDNISENDIANLSSDEQLIVNLFKKTGAFYSKETLLKKAGLDSKSNILKNLEKKNILACNCTGVSKLEGKTLKTAVLNSDIEINNIKLTEKQKKITDLLNQTGSASVAELCYYTGLTASVVLALEKKGVITLKDEKFFRKPSLLYSENASKSVITLTDEQNKAYTGLREYLFSNRAECALLYGVTGSGKTSVYMRLIDDAVNSDGGIIVTVPEISLTPQALEKFYKRYGNTVAVFHSGLSQGERADEWRRVKNGEAKIALGTRSAVFAPFEKIRLIIMDEEQEHTYKSDRTPRYKTSDVAKYLCSRDNALLVLSSATPSIESYTYASANRYRLFELKKRYGSAELPEVEIVDISSLSKERPIPISEELENALRTNLENHNQSIFLLNRRGYNTFIACSSCKSVLTCPNCSISLTYHKANNRLMCHYCGYSAPMQDKCPECGEETIRYSGIGTQKLEDALYDMFPSARILRMDADTTIAKFSHEKKLKDFSDGKYDIMIGTQMVAKGLDFPNVTLVGVLSADMGIYSDDFRAGEKTFDLITQVVGRAGRRNRKGKAIIQTMFPDNEIIQYAAMQDYDSFYKSEIDNRRAMIYPPFCDICVMGFISESEAAARSGANFLLTQLQEICSEKYEDLKLIVIGPAESSVHKVGNKYRYGIMIKCRNTKKFREFIRELLIVFSKERKYKNVSIFADINPESLF